MPSNKGTRSANTMQEYLSGLLQDVAYMQSLPDADLEYLTNLQAVVLTKLREPMEAAMTAAAAGSNATGPPSLGSATPGLGSPMGGPPAPPMGGPPPMGPPPGLGLPPGLMAGGGGPGPALARGGPALPPGLRNGGTIPPVDELRRLVGGM